MLLKNVKQITLVFCNWIHIPRGQFIALFPGSIGERPAPPGKVGAEINLGKLTIVYNPAV